MVLLAAAAAQSVGLLNAVTPANITLFPFPRTNPTHTTSAAFIISETHNSLHCANPLAPLNFELFLYSTLCWDPGTDPRKAERDIGSPSHPPLVSRPTRYYSNQPPGLHRHHPIFFAWISTLPACHRHLAPKIALIICPSDPRPARELISTSGSGQEVHLVGTQPDVNPTGTNLWLSTDIARIGRSLVGHFQVGSSRERKKRRTRKIV